MFEAWSCSRPVILSVEGEAQQILSDSGAGIPAVPEDPASMAHAILQLARDPQAAAAMGSRGRDYVVTHYSRRHQAQALESLLKNVVRKP
jgi:glycosyltransferase involved in cell wall biosynthesis